VLRFVVVFGSRDEDLQTCLSVLNRTQKEKKKVEKPSQNRPKKKMLVKFLCCSFLFCFVFWMMSSLSFPKTNKTNNSNIFKNFVCFLCHVFYAVYNSLKKKEGRECLKP